MKKINKEKRFTIRITEKEENLIRKEAHILGFQNNISQHLRNKILKKYMNTVNPNRLIDELYLLRAELNKIGSNLNQIANYTNFLLKNNCVEHLQINEMMKIELNFEDKISELKDTINKTVDKV